jgi:muramoyltetrapeptide carboxypeptidase
LNRFLDKDSHIGLIAPAGHVTPEDISMGVQLLTDAGFKVTSGNNLFGKNRYFSGTIRERIQDINSFLDNPDIEAIYAVRGGSGTSQLLDYLNFAKWKKTGKLFIGFSDVTAMMWPLWQQADIRSFSGMTLTSQLNPENLYVDDFFNMIRGNKHTVSAADLNNADLQLKSGGVSRGILLGGTLTIINSLLGTPYLKKSQRDVILFLEDTNEKLYHIERSMVQLKQAGFLNSVRGIIFGQFLYRNKQQNIWPAVKEHLPENIPVVLNFPYGHFSQSYPLPFGVSVQFNANPFSLEW